jgi:hypothetical protein
MKQTLFVAVFTLLLASSAYDEWVNKECDRINRETEQRIEENHRTVFVGTQTTAPAPLQAQPSSNPQEDLHQQLERRIEIRNLKRDLEDSQQAVKDKQREEEFRRLYIPPHR